MHSIGSSPAASTPVAFRLRPSSFRHRERGFSLIELLVVTIIFAEIMVAVGILLDVNERVSRVQTQVADLQQSMRVAQMDIERMVRIAGRGGLPHGLDFTVATPGDLRGFAIALRNNVGVGAAPESREAAIGFAGSPDAVAGTDILAVRGCFDSPLYQIRAGDFSSDLDGDGNRSDGRLIVSNPGPSSLCQNLTTLTQAIGRPLLVVSPLHQSVLAAPAARTFAVARIANVAPAAGLTNNCDLVAPEQVTVTLDFDPLTDPYLKPFNADVFPTSLTNVAWACVLEEHRYYVREEYAVPGVDTSELKPRLSRAAMEPGLEIPLGATAAERGANLRLDLADNIFDLQVALGYDSDFPQPAGLTPGAFMDDINFVGPDDSVLEAAAAGDRVSDDWLFNSEDDDPLAGSWRSHVRIPGAPVNLEYLRVTLLGRADRPDSRFHAEPLTEVEDHDYTVAPSNAFNSDAALTHRRRMLQTVIDPRNL